MSAIESEAAAAMADPAGAEAPEPRPPENGGPETHSSPSRKRRPAPYSRSFRGFLEQLAKTRASSTRGAANCGTLLTRKTASRRTWWKTWWRTGGSWAA